MPNRIRQLKHTYAAADEPLSELVRYAYAGFDANAFGFVERRGPEAARQLLRYLTDLPAQARCVSTRHFLVGSTSRPTASSEVLDRWDELLAEAFKLAQVDPVDDLEDGAHEFVKRVLPLMESAAAIASPRLVAWGVLPKD